MFRRSWDRVCQALCPTGAPSCPEDAAEERCYWRTNVTIAHDVIENGAVFQAVGFARGNYNYRTDSVALNFVGTALRDCIGVPNPSACYASGNIPYSIHHTGGDDGFAVRDHEGNVSYRAPLFNGRIEHGRGLAAERYLTNPLSGADGALIAPYYQRELAGRPMAGTYEIRVWEDPGIRFDRLEDVQVVWSYRYWTRLD